MFSCRTCREKDARIADLKEQIAMLRRLALPDNNPHNPTAHALEADAILSGQQHVIEIDESELPDTEMDAITHERDRILSGTY